MPNIHDATASQGIIKLICDEFLKSQVDLLHLTNKWTHYKHHEEAGLITFIADIDKKKYQKVERDIKSINRTKPKSLENFFIKEESKVVPYTLNKLFFSIHREHKKQAPIIGIVREIAKVLGFYEVNVVVDKNVGVVTHEVVERIKSSQAFLQLLWFSESDEIETARFSWVTLNMVWQ